MGFKITWTDTNLAEEGHRVYRSKSPMDPAALPLPLAEVGSGVTEYEDGDVTPGATYYYRVGAFTGSVERVSGEFEAIAEESALSPPLRDTVSVALVVADSGHGATGNTKQALLDAGFLDTNITVSLDSAAPPAADVIVICRAVSTQADWDLIAPAWNAGVPVLFGIADGGTEGTGRSMVATFAGLTGSWSIDDTNPGANENDIVDTSHYITQPFALGVLPILTGQNYGFALDPDASFVGTCLATGDPEGNYASGNPTLIVVPRGTLDLSGNPTPAKSVVWGDIYGGQSAYTADGAELLARCIDWCLG